MLIGLRDKFMLAFSIQFDAVDADESCYAPVKGAGEALHNESLPRWERV